MLARNFKTPAELGITDRQFKGLVMVLNACERGELKHMDWNTLCCAKTTHCSHHEYHNQFNMRTWMYSTNECGTVACIGGTACLLMKDHNLFRDRPEKLHDLFYPFKACSDDPTGFKNITVEQAQHALLTYLQTGTAEWVF